MNNSLENLSDIIRSASRTVPDFPVKGVQFRDLTTVLKRPDLFRMIVDATAEYYLKNHIKVDKVVGIESRGFIVAAAVAIQLGAGFVPIRKPGKLPADTISATYEKEYGPDVIEIHKDAIDPGDTVIIHDDILATGGTIAAACQLVEAMKPAAIYLNFIATLPALKGTDHIPAKYLDKMTSLVEF